MRTLVTGATGFIGRNLLRELNDAVVLTRSPERARGLPGDPTVVAWSPRSGPPPATAFAGVGAVIHLAGEPIAAGRWTDSRKRRILESRRQGTRALVEGMVAAQDRPRVFVSSSAVGYYGDRGDEVLTEASGPGTGFLSEVAGVWEAEALRASAAGIRTVVVRTGLVLGPDGGMLAKLRLPFSLGLGTVLASGRHWMPWIHRDDLIRLLLHVCRADVTGPFNAASPGIVRNREFTHALAGSLGRPAFLTVPGFALRLMLGEMATLLLGSTRAVPAQAAKCGFEFRHVDIHETFLDLLR